MNDQKIIQKGSRKYIIDTEKRQRFNNGRYKIFTVETTTIVTINDREVERFLQQNGRLPDHVYRVDEYDRGRR